MAFVFIFRCYDLRTFLQSSFRSDMMARGQQHVQGSKRPGPVAAKNNIYIKLIFERLSTSYHWWWCTVDAAAFLLLGVFTISKSLPSSLNYFHDYINTPHAWLFNGKLSLHGRLHLLYGPRHLPRVSPWSLAKCTLKYSLYCKYVVCVTKWSKFSMYLSCEVLGPYSEPK